LDTDELIRRILRQKTEQIRDNANIQSSPSVIDYYLSSKVEEEFALKHFYSKDVVEHHNNGSIYIHTLHSPFKPYCNGFDSRIFLLDGLRFPHCRSLPAKHFSSAVYQSMAFMFYSQLFFAGAQAMDYYNWFMAPYLRHEKLGYKEVKQVLQGVVYQLNQANRTGAQSAFTNFGLRIKCPSYLKDEKIIFNGKKQKNTYGEYEKEARIIYKALMEIMAEGDGNRVPFTFPIITTAITKDWNWNDELVNVTLDTAARTGAPYFLNLTTPYMDEKYVHAMCCRLLVKHSGGVWQAGGLGTGSNKVVTINLPHLALKSKNENNFFELLRNEMRVARKALLESNEIIKNSLTKWDLLPLLKMKTNDGAAYYNFKERKLTFGVIGMNECLINLIGEGIASKEGLRLALKTIMEMDTLIEEFSKKDNVGYALEQTPAEAATNKLALKDKKKFGRKACTQGKGKAVYYSNSTHVPYKHKVSLIEKIETEAHFHPLFSGGVICHLWIGESKPSVASMKNLVHKLSKTNLAYFTFSPDYSVCANNHHVRGKHRICPTCRAKIVDHINRVVGFFTRTSKWNAGKQQEYRERHRYEI
jgi:ribonucleoside-triphosphate reductase